MIDLDKMDHSLQIIVSGGQTGVDQAALFAARTCNLRTGGWIPSGFQTLAGPAPWLAGYGLKPLTVASPGWHQYIIRSKMNVDLADGTLAIRTHSSSGTDKTIGYALTHVWKTIPRWDIPTSYKPCCVISDLKSEAQRDAAIHFIDHHKIRTLNICGHRETELSGAWTSMVTAYLIDLLTRVATRTL
jgi:hypothetical protein